MASPPPSLSSPSTTTATAATTTATTPAAPAAGLPQPPAALAVWDWTFWRDAIAHHSAANFQLALECFSQIKDRSQNALITLNIAIVLSHIPGHDHDVVEVMDIRIPDCRTGEGDLDMMAKWVRAVCLARSGQFEKAYDEFQKMQEFMLPSIPSISMYRHGFSYTIHAFEVIVNKAWCAWHLDAIELAAEIVSDALALAVNPAHRNCFAQIMREGFDDVGTFGVSPLDGLFPPPGGGEGQVPVAAQKQPDLALADDVDRSMAETDGVEFGFGDASLLDDGTVARGTVAPSRGHTERDFVEPVAPARGGTIGRDMTVLLQDVDDSWSEPPTLNRTADQLRLPSLDLSLDPITLGRHWNDMSAINSDHEGPADKSSATAAVPERKERNQQIESDVEIGKAVLEVRNRDSASALPTSVTPQLSTLMDPPIPPPRKDSEKQPSPPSDTTSSSLNPEMMSTLSLLRAGSGVVAPRRTSLSPAVNNLIAGSLPRSSPSSSSSSSRPSLLRRSYGSGYSAMEARRKMANGSSSVAADAARDSHYFSFVAGDDRAALTLGAGLNDVVEGEKADAFHGWDAETAEVPDVEAVGSKDPLPHNPLELTARSAPPFPDRPTPAAAAAPLAPAAAEHHPQAAVPAFSRTPPARNDYDGSIDTPILSSTLHVRLASGPTTSPSSASSSSSSSSPSSPYRWVVRWCVLTRSALKIYKDKTYLSPDLTLPLRD
ncbi:hypothetical protein DFJ73DRAFT_963820, partial [Zopfochytrium polystomum]